MLLDIAAPIIGYLSGSIASAIVICKLLGLPDPRESGSRNPGATNVLRLGGKTAAGLTLLGDVLKGAVPVLLARHLGASTTAVALTAAAAFLGHLFPLFFGFKGGKGVATAFGSIAALSWPVVLAMGAVWLTSAAVSRYSSLSSLLAVSAAPLAAAVWAPHMATIGVLAGIAMLVLWRHKANIQRLLAGTESKIGRHAGRPTTTAGEADPDPR